MSTTCQRCGGTPARGWCKDCEQLYDGWVRKHASDIVWQALAGGVVVASIGMGLPLLGIGWLIAATGAFAGFGTLYGLSRLNRRRRRREFLQTTLPRAYLSAPK